MLNNRAAFVEALRAAGIRDAIASIEPLSGGCISCVHRVVLGSGKSLVMKSGGADTRRPFEEEAAGLRAIAQKDAVPVPEPIGVYAVSGRSALLMSYLPPGRATARGWEKFGCELARLHAADAGPRYGFEIDNHLGATRQVNEWHDDWVEFNRVNRFMFQHRLAREHGLVRPDESRLIDRMIDRLDVLLPRRPRPSLVHGDLWSGNVVPTLGGRIAVIDPAPSVGDGWADIAMMRLFGGVPDRCFDAYASSVENRGDVKTQIAVYQVYHLLNHVNIFGRSYLGQMLSAVRRLL